MSWLSGGEFHAPAWTSSSYPGHGILAENAPSTGDSGPSLGYKPEWFGSEVRFELVTPPTHGTIELFEDTSFIYTGDGSTDSFILQAFVDGVAEAEATTVNLLNSGIAYSISCETVSDSHSTGDVDFYRSYNLLCDAVADDHSAGDVSLIYSEFTGIAYSINCETVTDSHAASDVSFSVSYHLLCNAASDSHQAQPVSLIYSGSEVVLIGAYSVNYKQSDVSASYKQTFVEERYGNG